MRGGANQMGKMGARQARAEGRRRWRHLGRPSECAAGWSPPPALGNPTFAEGGFALAAPDVPPRSDTTPPTGTGIRCPSGLKPCLLIADNR